MEHAWVNRHALLLCLSLTIVAPACALEQEEAEPTTGGKQDGASDSGDDDPEGPRVIGSCVVTDTAPSATPRLWHYDEIGRLVRVEESTDLTDLSWSGERAVSFTSADRAFELEYENQLLVRRTQRQNGDVSFVMTVEYDGGRISAEETLLANPERFYSRTVFIHAGDKLREIAETTNSAEYSTLIEYYNDGGISKLDEDGQVIVFDVDDERRPISLRRPEQSGERVLKYEGPGCREVALSWRKGYPTIVEPWLTDMANL